jgi:hypothetical protein
VYQAINYVKQTLTGSYTAASGSITVPNGAAFGTPTPTSPVTLTAYKAATPTVPIWNAKITARSGNTLTINSFTWGSDASLVAGDLVAIAPTAEMITELQTAVYGKADDVHTHAADDITSGVLGLTNGGTGATTASGARANLELIVGGHVQAYDPDLDSLSTVDKTKGNLTVASGSTFSFLPAGTNGQILQSLSSAPNGLAWTDGGSHILQFAQTGGVTVSNTTTESTLFSATALGSRTTPAAKLIVGDVYRIRCAGFYNSPASGGGAATHRLRINGTQVLTTGAQTIPTSAANNFFSIEAWVLIRIIGSGGSVGGTLVGHLAATSTSLQPRMVATAGPVSIDMSTSIEFDVTIEMNTLHASNLWQGAQGTIERMRVMV